jgi:hypothetical protein
MENDLSPLGALLRKLGFLPTPDERGASKLGHMMRMDSGNWRGPGTEYALQGQQAQHAQQISDVVPRGY